MHESCKKIKVKLKTGTLLSTASYKGTFNTIDELNNVIAYNGDIADVYETNTRWKYEDGWVNTRIAIPYNNNLSATILPNDTSFEASQLGTSKRYALEDHVHKQLEDTTKVNKSDVEQMHEAIEQQILDEINRATVAEETLQGNIISETEKVKLELSKAIDFENNRAEQAEQLLKNSILNETTRALSAEQRLSESVNDAKSELQTSINNETSRAIQSEESINTKLNAIESKIPEQASAQNQLADKAYVNSSVMNNAARYITPDAAADEQWPSLNALRIGPWYNQGVSVAPTKNDYAIYIETDKSVWRASFDGTLWSSQYKVNDSPFTQAQLSAINSGITAELVTLINIHLASSTNPHNVTAAQVGLGNVNDTSDINKPVSTAQAAAIADAKKAGTDAQAAINVHVDDRTNPHVVTKTQVGLENVDNVRQYSDTNPPPYPVKMVNNKTGNVELTYGELGLTVNGKTDVDQSIYAPTTVGDNGTILTSENGNMVWKNAMAPTADLSNQNADFGQNARNGNLDTAARSDHYHAIPTPTGSQIKTWLDTTVLSNRNIPSAVIGDTYPGGIKIVQFDASTGFLAIEV